MLHFVLFVMSHLLCFAPLKWYIKASRKHRYNN